MDSKERGFTLIDTILAVAIAAVLSSIALPSFEAPLRKARRTDALVAAAEIQGAQERLRSRGTRYGSLGEIGVAPTSRSGHYALQVTAFDADSYAALAIATGAQARDTECRYMSVRSVNANLIFASGANDSVANATTTNRRCWSL